MQKSRLSSSGRAASAVLVLLLFVIVAAQQPQAPPSPYSPGLIQDLKRLHAAALASDYDYRQVAYLCNNIGPRLSGSPQAQAAVEYVASEMRKLGAEVRLEKVMVPHWVRGEEKAALVEYPGMAPGTTQKVVVTALGNTIATPPEGLTAEVVPVSSFEELTALGRERVAGKIVLYNVRFDRRLAEMGHAGQAYGQAVTYRWAGPSAAARLGAVASLVRSVGGADYRLPHTGSFAYAEDAPRIPAGAVAAEDADLIQHLSAQGRVRLKLLLTPQTLPDVESYNVIADLKGSENPEQVVIVSGHLDSWDLGTGALDDAVGVAEAMQVLNLVKQLNLRPRRTLRFIAWMNEENGLAGGRTYAENQKAEIANHIAAIESDEGAGHALGFRAHVNEKAMPMLQPLAAILRASGAGTIERVDTPVGADISPLENAGVPGFAPLQDDRTYFDYHHTPADTFDKVGKRELAENSAVLSVLAYAIASLPEPLPR
ncbi:MAG TPA: M20/M25/M40 family metallo-hydrolase [Blastocatellia bacterium]|nr:M20/M25/M40 family metallo-hydrolase [Blastocatellia bacterium]